MVVKMKVLSNVAGGSGFVLVVIFFVLNVWGVRSIDIGGDCGLDWCAGGKGEYWGWDNPHFELMRGSS